MDDVRSDSQLCVLLQMKTVAALIVAALAVLASFSPAVHAQNEGNPVTNNAYGVVDQVIYFGKADGYCRYQGGVLATIHNPSDNLFVAKLCNTTKYIKSEQSREVLRAISAVGSATNVSVGCWLGSSRKFNLAQCCIPRTAVGVTLSSAPKCRNVSSPFCLSALQKLASISSEQSHTV
jgi:hypothetical protein